MFYLLENNAIVDSENDTRFFEENNKLYRLNRFDETITYHGKIKKQSENVFDLVEMGDCYLYQNQNMLRPEILLINDKVMFSIFGSRAMKQPQYILAIYKPDDKGNYIKVWERKEDE